MAGMADVMSMMKQRMGMGDSTPDPGLQVMPPTPSSPMAGVMDSAAQADPTLLQRLLAKLKGSTAAAVPNPTVQPPVPVPPTPDPRSGMGVNERKLFDQLGSGQ